MAATKNDTSAKNNNTTTSQNDTVAEMAGGVGCFVVGIVAAVLLALAIRATDWYKRTFGGETTTTEQVQSNDNTEERRYRSYEYWRNHDKYQNDSREKQYDEVHGGHAPTSSEQERPAQTPRTYESEKESNQEQSQK